MYTIKAPNGDKLTVELKYWSYADNHNLYIGLVVDKDYEDHEVFKWEPWCDLTVNIGSLLPNEIALDVNNFPDALEFVKENNIANLIRYTTSGFVKYPIVRFTDEFFRENSLHILAQC